MQLERLLTVCPSDLPISSPPADAQHGVWVQGTGQTSDKSDCQRQEQGWQACCGAPHGARSIHDVWQATGSLATAKFVTHSTTASCVSRPSQYLVHAALRTSRHIYSAAYESSRHRTPAGDCCEPAMAGRAPRRAEGYGMDLEDEGEDLR